MATNKVVLGSETIIDVSDTTADEWHVVKGYKFTSANGEKKEGKIPVYNGRALEANCGGNTSDGFAFDVTFGEPTFINEGEMTVSVPKDSFGDAKPSDVKKGKKFTSADGMYIEGTYEEGFAVTLPTSTVTVIDNDYAGDIVVTALVNEDGKLTYQSTTVSVGGSATITYAWYTPIFITSKWASSIMVEDAEGDPMRNCPQTYDATNKTFAVFPKIDGGDNHAVYVFQ